jgi:hypothetical protein
MTINRTGYHTVEDQDNPEYVEQHAPFLSASKDLAFLGPGYYFWDYKEELAHWWGKVHCDGSYMVCQSKVVVDKEEYLDLAGEPEDQEHLENLQKELRLDIERECGGNSEPPLGLLIQALTLINKKKKGIFDYKVIRAADCVGEKRAFIKSRSNFTYSNPRFILCLTARNRVILPDFRIIYPNKYVI